MAEFDLTKLKGPEIYQLTTRIVGPRPIAFVSTISKDGVPNLAPFSYFNLGGLNPPSAIFCPVNNRDGKEKDTLLNIEETGEYVINIVNEDVLPGMNQSSWSYPRDVNEFGPAGLTEVASTKVKPPRVGEAPAALEMKLHEIIRHGKGMLASNYIIGEIVYIHLKDELITDGMPDNLKIKQIGRIGRDDYCRVDENSVFEIARPTGA